MADCSCILLISSPLVLLEPESMSAHAGDGYGTTLLVVTWVEGAIAFLLLLARIYTTWRITRHIRSDLYLTLLTFVRPHVGDLGDTRNIAC